ncbi:MAG TPA: hypothetical protein PK453_25650 [Leptospiraceae bacterium]|nr:hypothetical protein [Leptospiraceae bacterium]HNF17067.1 hypothetical protein [Leptospiraceae bacterium]HNF26563.1 hypothetical protein [Leptospiraceae bacterium]
MDSILTVACTLIICLLFTGCEKNSPRYWSEYYAERERDHIARGQNLQGKTYCEEMNICLQSCAEKNPPYTSIRASNPRTGFNYTIYSTLLECEKNCRFFDPCGDKEKKNQKLKTEIFSDEAGEK